MTMPHQPRKFFSLHSPLAILLLAFLLLTPTIRCLAQANSPDSQQTVESRKTTSDAESIFGEVNSPFCPGRLLRDCPSSAAVSLKEEITAQLAAGSTKEQIKAELFERYGDEVNPLPKTSGFAGLAWWGPIAFLILGLAIVATISLRRTPLQNAQPSTVQGSIAERLDDLERLVRDKTE